MNKNNTEKINKIIDRLKRISLKGLDTSDLELSLQSVAACAKIEFYWNQKYCDNTLETVVERISSEYRKQGLFIPDENYIGDENTVLFYDEPGYDMRALSIVYLTGLARAGFKVVFVTRKESKDKQPVLNNAVKEYSIIKEYYSMKTEYSEQIKNLSRLINKYKPFAVIAHSNAYDPVWPVVFSLFKNRVKRYNVNLTDHGFWLGKNDVDYVLEFRDYGASVSSHYRKLDRKRLIKLPYYPYINKDIAFQGLPFDPSAEFIFTGGGLYKTFDDDNTYYKMIAHLLQEFKQLNFLYAGKGDDSRIVSLSEKFPNRVYHIMERTDLYQIMKRCKLYINSYPVVGGLMTQYAAASGRIPLTINHDGRAEGILLRQEDGVFFENKQDLLCEAEKLLSNDEYYNERTALMSDLVITPEKFSEELKKALLSDHTSFDICINKIETESVHREHAYSFASINIYRAIAQKNHKKLIKYFPTKFIKRFVLSVQGKM